MRQLIVGEPASGKSLKAEQLVLSYATGQIAYIATLPENKAESSRILRHRARRGPEWVTWEMSDSGDESLCRIRSAFENHRHVLLDGISMLVWRVAVSNGTLDHALADKFLQAVTDLLVNHCGDWVLVDSSKPYPDLVSGDPFTDLLSSYHNHWRVLQTSQRPVSR